MGVGDIAPPGMPPVCRLRKQLLEQHCSCAINQVSALRLILMKQWRDTFLQAPARVGLAAEYVLHDADDDKYPAEDGQHAHHDAELAPEDDPPVREPDLHQRHLALFRSFAHLPILAFADQDLVGPSDGCYAGRVGPFLLRGNGPMSLQSVGFFFEVPSGR